MIPILLGIGTVLMTIILIVVLMTIILIVVWSGEKKRKFQNCPQCGNEITEGKKFCGYCGCTTG